MPSAHAGETKYAYLDHDTDYLEAAPPVLNQWYTVFHAYDVRLLFCVILQSNNDVAAKDVEVRWTIDGNVYFVPDSPPHNTLHWVIRYHPPSTAGTDGLMTVGGIDNGANFCDKRGHDFMVEVRLTSALGVNQKLKCWCVRETLEQT